MLLFSSSFHFELRDRLSVVHAYVEVGTLCGIQLLKDHCAKRFEYIKAGDVEGAVAWTKACLQEAIEGDRTLYGDR